MDHSPLGRLPAELRNEIYYHAFALDGALEFLSQVSQQGRLWDNAVTWTVGCASTGVAPRGRPLPAHFADFTQACRQIRNEAWPVLHSANEWTIEHRFAAHFVDWLRDSSSTPDPVLIRRINIIIYAVPIFDTDLSAPPISDECLFKSTYLNCQTFESFWGKAQTRVEMVLKGFLWPRPETENVELMLRHESELHVSSLMELAGEVQAFIDRGNSLFELAAAKLSCDEHSQRLLQNYQVVWDGHRRFLKQLADMARAKQN